MLARRKPLSVRPSYTPRDAIQPASAIAANPKYMQQQDGEKIGTNVVAALGNTHKTTSIIGALRLVIIERFFSVSPVMELIRVSLNSLVQRTAGGLSA